MTGNEGSSASSCTIASQAGRTGTCVIEAATALLRRFRGTEAGGCHPAVDHELGGGDVTRFIACKEEHGVRDVPRIAHPPHRHERVALGHPFTRILAKLFDETMPHQRRI